ncbi:MAG: hypothetical protein ABSC41_14055 [Acidimicrobiales bacterium]|jgi:hypothetical protein
MDTATAPSGPPDPPPVADVPAIGVASIPVPTDRARPPATVPSASPSPEPDGSVSGQAPPVGTDGGDRSGASIHDDAAPGFSPGVSARLRSYVYLLIDPRTGRPFYVGRGRNDRCFRHLMAARTGLDEQAKYPMLERIRQIESGDRTVRIDILRHGLSPDEALLVEAAAHETLGLPGRPELGPQRRSAVEVASLLAKRAKIKRGHQLVLLRVGAAGADTSYDRVRHEWRIGRRWTDPDSLRAPRWAAIVAGDVIAAVYRIERWEASWVPGHGGDRPADRFSFVGSPDPELEKRYGGRSVAAYGAVGSRSPVSYVWCGPHWINTPG